MAKSNTEDDLIKNMEALGFDDYEDELCKRDWCQKELLKKLKTFKRH